MASYRLLRMLGEGGMAEVWLAEALGAAGFRRLCAVKRPLPGVRTDALLDSRLRDEARLAARLRHPCVVAVLDLYEVDDTPHLVMEYVEGVSADQLVHRALAGRFVPLSIATRIIRDTARALAHAHAHGLLHRDVSGGNVLLSREGEVKLGDFGLADGPGRTTQTLPGSTGGKEAYLSPERLRGERAGPDDDLYALGVLADRLWAAADPRERRGAEGRQLRSIADQLRLPRGERPVDPALVVDQADTLLGAMPRAGAEQLASWVRATGPAAAVTPRVIDHVDLAEPERIMVRQPALTADDLDETTCAGAPPPRAPPAPDASSAGRPATLVGRALNALRRPPR